MRKCLSYDDVLLEPQYSDISTRADIDISSDFGKFNLETPIISSPMDTVTEFDMAYALHQNGGMGIIHRYKTPREQFILARELATSEIKFGVAIGTAGDFIQRVYELHQTGVNIFCIDVAHGHHACVEKVIKTLKDQYNSDIHIMAGNVATLEGFNDLADWGADSIRVGIGGGSICSTRVQTGHGIPTLQSVLDCSLSDRNAKLVADGGIKNSGDIVKCLAAGADAVMLGSLLAGTEEAPGELINFDGRKRKIYRGMASKEAQNDWRGRYSSIEGISSSVLFRGPVDNILRDLEQGIRSGFSYSGARNLKEFQSKAKFIIQTAAGQIESSTHIMRR